MPFVHLPIQSGSDRILKLMNRKHKVEDYLDVYYKIKKLNSEVEFSSDFIIGYPGEKEEDFKNTLNLIEKINFINSYSFIFSARPGTVAFDLEPDFVAFHHIIRLLFILFIVPIILRLLEKTKIKN